jgi:riboflavin synthase
MFTGIVLAQGRLEAVTERGGDLEIGIACPGLDLARTALGDSISVQGVCLTVTRKAAQTFFADVSRETMAKTTLGDRAVGAPLNLEPSLRVGDALGGHWVTGHVDAVTSLQRADPDARSWRLEFALPAELARFVAAKGSVCVDGVSLTVNQVTDASFDVNLIPHTLDVTTLGTLRPGDRVNIEIDVVARYLDRLSAATRILP